MALTSQILKANAVLASLTDEQVAAITTLSQNDESAVIAQKTGELYGGLDKDILAVSGIDKNGIEKTYDYLKRVITAIKEKAGESETLNAQIEELTKEKKTLEDAVKNNTTDKELAKKLEQVTAELNTTKEQFIALKQDSETAATKHKTELMDLQIGHVLTQAASGVKIKPEIPQSAVGTLIAQATAKLKTYSPDFIEDGNGGKRLVFRNADGAIMNNAENKLEPYTADELLTKELKAMGILDEGRKQQGGGTGGNTGGSDEKSALEISNAKTGKEAMMAIEQTLMERGMMRNTPEFQAEIDKAWVENGCNKLPVE